MFPRGKEGDGFREEEEKTPCYGKTWALVSAVGLHHLSCLLPLVAPCLGATCPPEDNLGTAYSRRGAAQVHRLESRGQRCCCRGDKRYH